MIRAKSTKRPAKDWLTQELNITILSHLYIYKFETEGYFTSVGKTILFLLVS